MMQVVLFGDKKTRDSLSSTLITESTEGVRARVVSTAVMLTGEVTERQSINPAMMLVRTEITCQYN